MFQSDCNEVITNGGIFNVVVVIPCPVGATNPPYSYFGSVPDMTPDFERDPDILSY